MSATHDTHRWDTPLPLNADLERRSSEARERGDALNQAAEEIGNRLADQLPEADSATRIRALNAAGTYLAHAGRTDDTTIATAVRLGVAAAGCP